MATLLHSESRRLYSWWWDSHISPKNSKWLQENLTDMDAKVKVMIKLIEEDADSFARRAEMYYKKRPELMKLVEEFYRAYRALAERYDHATGELRQAHKTMAEAFPNQAPFVLADDSPSGSVHGTEPHTPEMAHPVRAPSDPDDLQKDALGISASDLHLFKRNGCFSGDSDGVISKRGLKQLYEIEVEIEVQNLKKALTDMQTEKEAVLFKYQQSLEKLSSLEGELFCAENDSRRLNEKAINAESEFLNLKQAISKLESERDAGFIKNKDCSERISNLEVMVLRAQKDAKGLDERAIKAETEAQYLKNELLRLETEKESGLLQYKQCLEKISVLEKKVFFAEEDVRHLTQQAERAETEVGKLKLSLLEVTAQKEAGDLQYKLCLEKTSKLESEISCAQEDIRGLNSEILMGATKLRTAEGKCDLLEMSNQALRLEADNLIKKIMMKDKELSEKHGELEKLGVCVHDERSRYHKVEATLSTLQNMYSQSQEEQRNLELELKNGLQMLKDMEICKHGLQEEIQEIKGENQSLNELNSSSTISIRDLQNEILGLTKMKERFEEEVSLQLGRSNTLQQEICCLKEEIKGLNGSYEALIKQVELVGLNPKCIGTSVKELQDENSRLKQVREQDKYEKETLFKKVVNMEELLKKNAVLESSLSDVNGELEESKEKAKLLQETCNILHEEKSSVVGEKAVLLSQLQIITENMQKLLEKNNVLENSLCGANVELEGLRGQSKRLAELCHLFGDEKANLLTERSALAGQLETVEQRLVDLLKRYVEFEKKYAGLEKEKESTHLQLEELRVSFELEKQERATLIQRSESQLVSLNSQIHLLQEENRWRKKEFLEELDKAAISQFEIFILQKFVEDMEEKNYSILMECQKQIEASKLADKLISELKNENLEQHVEVEILLVEVEKLRLGISQVFKSLEIGPYSGSEEEIEKVQIFVHHILEDIVNMKNSLSKYTDDNHQLIVENSLLLTLLGQSTLEGLEVESEKNNLGRAFRTMKERILMMETEKNELLEMNRQLRSEVSMGTHHANMLMAEVESLKEKQAGMQSDYLKLQEEYSQTLEENSSSLKRFSDLEEEKCLVEEESNKILLEMLTCSNLSKILESARTKDAVELKLLSKDVHELHGVNNELEKEVNTLREKLGMNESESSHMKDLVEKLEMELSGVKDLNCKLKNEISSKEDFLSCKIKELSDAKQKLITTGNLNSELFITVEGLKSQSENLELVKENLKVQIFKLSEDNTNQKKEIEYLLEVKGNLEYELGNLNGEIKKRRILEENMNSELQERRNEFELWDAEAATFYFDLQLSTIGEVLFEDKVRELTGVCQSLQDESASKTEEIEQMKERISSQESEIGGLQSQILAYAPAIASLRDSVESLEHNTLSRAKLVVADYQIPKDVEVEVHAPEKSYQELVVNQNSRIPNEILDLQNRIKAVEKVLVEEANKLQESSIANAKNGILPEAKNGILMKDIPLDQVSDSSLHRGSSRADDPMLVLWETSDDNHSIDDIIFNQFEDAGQRNKNPCSELEIEKELGVVDKLQLSTSSISSMNETGNKKKVLERLASDGGKLANIQTSVQILRRKLESDKKSRKGKNIDLETVKEQLQEAEETAVQLFDLNGQMTKKIEEIPFFSDGKGFSELDVQKKKVSEQARKESEKIGRLQLEVQKIQYMLQKVENEKKRNRKIGFPSSNRGTTMILRNFIHSSSKRSSGRKNNGRFCGCFKPSTSGEE